MGASGGTELAMNQAIEVTDLRSGAVLHAATRSAGAFCAEPEYGMFSAQAVGLATLFGTPAAGTALMAVNYQRLGKTGFALGTMLVGMAVSAAELVVGYGLPRADAWALAAGLWMMTWAAAVALQGRAVARHVRMGGRLISGWLGMFGGLAFLGLILLGVFALASSGPVRNKVMVGTKDEVFYTGLATEREARALGEALKTEGYFADRGTSVFLDQGKDGTTLAFGVSDGAWNDPELLAREEEVARAVAASLGGLPLRVKVVDAQQKVEMEGVVGRASVDGKDEVFYLGQASVAEATALDRELQDEGYLTGRGTSVVVSKDDAGTVLSFVVAEGFWNDTQRVETLEAMARKAAPLMGGLPLTLRLVNTALETRKEVAVE